MALEKYKIIIAGCGPGAVDFITPRAQAAVARAEILIGAKRLLDLFAQCPAEKIPVGGDIPAIIKAIDLNWRSRQTVVLVTGDPGLASLAGPIIKQFGRENCDVIAGISSVQVAFARMGLDWLDAKIIPVHGRIPELDFNELRNETRIAVLGGHEGMRDWLAGLLAFLGREHYRVFVCENLTLENELVYEVADAKLPAGLNISGRSVIIIFKKDLPA